MSNVGSFFNTMAANKAVLATRVYILVPVPARRRPSEREGEKTGL